MREHFSSRIRESEEEIQETWKKSLISYDANVLLNLYRYSNNTRVEFIKLMKLLSNRSWLSNQVVFEYFNNREDVIASQRKAYETARKSSDSLIDSIKSERSHPFVSEDTLRELDTVIERLNRELDSSRLAVDQRLERDEILADLLTIFASKVGPPFSTEQLEEIFPEATRRYAEKIPPGYMDRDKYKDQTDLVSLQKRYGDLLIWEQLIQIAKDKETDLIFVLNDVKEDWWTEHSGKALGPRHELKEEFRARTGRSILMYVPDRFLAQAKVNLDEGISDRAVEEARKLPELHELRHRHDEAVLQAENLRIVSEILARNLPENASSDNVISAELVARVSDRRRLQKVLVMHEEKLMELTDRINKLKKSGIVDDGKGGDMISDLETEMKKRQMSALRLTEELSRMNSQISYLEQILSQANASDNLYE